MMPRQFIRDKPSHEPAPTCQQDLHAIGDTVSPLEGIPM
jgi:hypothetical protein